MAEVADSQTDAEKAYIRKHNLHVLLDEIATRILDNRPEDPNAVLAQQLALESRRRHVDEDHQRFLDQCYTHLQKHEALLREKVLRLQGRTQVSIKEQ